ncbi:LPXTG cell wall anchor domain-containing protein [Weissella viridescens]|uniref:LPXTG cell wall anchor domain-containing protein n=1 Tax=Weissella viridescens TaxID=1629 RepID=A0A3P2RGU7_WEIVI|nr:KxYKxGKxW signal peptide domain-containing protein [Weissella viridescens]RRG18805.1 LPXTG cell wall anchor domain-containing protein [Weissella viridescens]
MNESKEHVKMFKSGKLWVSALVGTLFSTALVGANATNAHADDVDTTAPAQGTVQQGSTTTTNNTVTLSAGSTTDATAPVSASTSVATSASTTDATSASASQSVSASAAASQSTTSASTTAVSTSAATSTSTATSLVSGQVKVLATSTAASTDKYADGTYPLDTSNSYKKKGTTEPSTMQNYMGDKSSVTIKGNQAILTLSAASPEDADMINSFTINGVTGTRQGDNFVFNLTTDQLDNVLNGHLSITYTIGTKTITETPDVDILLDMSSVLTPQQSLSNSQSASISQSQADSIAASQSTAASQSIADSIANSQSMAASQSAAASQSIADSVRASMSVADSASISASASQRQTDEAKKGPIANGSYDTTANYYKPGTHILSPGMNSNLLTGVKITVNGNQSQVIISATDEMSASLIKEFSIGGVEGTLNSDGKSWTFNIPTSDLSRTLAGKVLIVFGTTKMPQSFDVEFNTADLPRVKAPESQTPDSQSQGSQSQDSQSAGSQSQEASQSGQAQNPESDAKPAQPTQPESGSQAPSVSEQSGSMTEQTPVAPEANVNNSVSEAATSMPTATPVVSTQAEQNTPAAKTLPNTGSDQEAALTGLGVLIGTLGLGGILKKRH